MISTDTTNYNRITKIKNIKFIIVVIELMDSRYMVILDKKINRISLKYKTMMMIICEQMS